MIISKIKKPKRNRSSANYQHQEKMLEHRIPELTRKARTQRLCTRGGILESFLTCPGELTDDQVMELLHQAHEQTQKQDKASQKEQKVEL